MVSDSDALSSIYCKSVGRAVRVTVNSRPRPNQSNKKSELVDKLEMDETTLTSRLVLDTPLAGVDTIVAMNSERIVVTFI